MRDDEGIRHSGRAAFVLTAWKWAIPLMALFTLLLGTMLVSAPLIWLLPDRWAVTLLPLVFLGVAGGLFRTQWQEKRDELIRYKLASEPTEPIQRVLADQMWRDRAKRVRHAGYERAFGQTVFFTTLAVISFVVGAYKLMF